MATTPDIRLTVALAAVHAARPKTIRTMQRGDVDRTPGEAPRDQGFRQMDIEPARRHGVDGPAGEERGLNGRLQRDATVPRRDVSVPWSSSGHGPGTVA
ncbi:hypothetical protein PUR34_12435 [Streptomyces sp. JV185]|uniref:hypothetical protein n=1 Tax=Streptomyces sp. JV185 TaxID=858638 RepID=UPI002E784667|nr:hypothetical protein [Streptomyces sp. JV185]MEE1768940.1 hypothetical protein [Streptomyces sp. JV185]